LTIVEVESPLCVAAAGLDAKIILYSVITAELIKKLEDHKK